MMGPTSAPTPGSTPETRPRPTKLPASCCTQAEAARLWDTYRRSGNPGDGAAFERLYASFLPGVVRYCRALLRDAHLAEDVADAAFIRLMIKRPRLRSSFLGLLITTARNLCLNEITHGRDRPTRTQPLESAATRPESLDPADGAVHREELAALQDCLSQLNEEERTLILLREGHGLSYAEIAEVLGFDHAPSTFTRRLKSIKHKLLRCLQKK